MPSFLTQHNVRLVNSSPYHPQSQGKIERSNSELKRKLNYLKVTRAGGSNWAKCLSEVAYAINSQPKEVLGYQTPFAVYFGRGTSSADYIRRKASLASKRCGDRMKTVKGNFCCSIYKPGEKVLVKYPFQVRVPKRRSVVIAKILKRNKSFSKYQVTYTDPNGITKKTWVSVENITSLTVEEEKIRREKSKTYFLEKRQRENHRRKYYITLSSVEDAEEETDKDECERYHETNTCSGEKNKTDDTIFIPGVRITFNPTNYGNCQFDALAHQLNSLGLYRTGDQLRQSAIMHLRENRHLYVDFFRNDQYFDMYLDHMSLKTTYGDHFTLQAISRMFCLQILVISKLGQENHRIVSDSGRFELDLPIITVGHYPEGLGEHYVIVVCDNLNKFLSDTHDFVFTERVSVTQSSPSESENEIPLSANMENENSDRSSVVPANDSDVHQSDSDDVIVMPPETSPSLESPPPVPLSESTPSTNEDAENSPLPENGQIDHSDSFLADMPNTPLLPDLVLENVIRFCIDLYPESLFRLQYVNRFFMHVVRSIGLPRIHINNMIMPEVPNPVCIRRLVRRFGRHSGLTCRLREIIQDQRFFNTWLVLFSEGNNWYEIRNIFWKKRI